MEDGIGGTEILLNLAGGVALLVWGTRMVRTGVTRAYGAALRRLLAGVTRNRLFAAAGGLLAAAVLQSSTATVLMVVSFASRGLIAVAPALAVMLGADVGTTLVAQLLSLDLSLLSPVFVLVGVISFLARESGRSRHLGRVAIGLGLMLLALRLIIAASEPLRDAAALDAVLSPLASEPLLALLLAALLTWLAHSSLAMVLLIMSLALSGVISLPLAFVLVLGANVGGAIAPVFITLGAVATARRVPVGNLVMRGIGCLAVLPFLDLLAPYLALVESDPARQVVNFHTAFNLALMLVFLPLTDLVAFAVGRLMPAERKGDDEGQPRYLDEEALDTPSVAIASAARETLRMGDVVERMLARCIDVFRSNDAKLAREIEDMDDIVDRLHEAIKLYLTRLSRQELDEHESRRYVEVLTFTTNLEHIGDIIDKNLMELANKKIRYMLAFSPAGFQEISDFHAHVADNMRLAFNVFMSGDVKLARKLLAAKVEMRDAEQRSVERHLARMHEGRPESIETSSLHQDVIRDLKRINNHLTSVAYPILEAAGELRESRLLQREPAPPPEGAAEQSPEGGGKRAP